MYAIIISEKRWVSMDSREIINDSVTYIEKHLKEPLSLEVISSEAGYSPYYFSRLFTLYMEMPVMEYVRHRRIACAADDICKGGRILDIAVEYGFNSHTGFIKAFRKIYGYSPDEYRRRVSKHRPIAPNPLSSNVSKMSELPTVRIEKRDGFYVAGAVVMISSSVSSIAQQPVLWDKFWLAEHENRLYATARPKEHGEYYISFPANERQYRLMTCVKVESSETLDSGLFVDWVPEGLYAVFSTPPRDEKFPETIIETWRYIFETWLPNSGYALSDSGIDYEFYDERCHGAPYSMDICIPIKKL